MKISRRLTVIAMLACAWALSALAPATASAATTINVTTTADSGAGSLRAAIAAANTAGGTVTIDVPAGTYALSEGELNITSGSLTLTIDGAGAGSTIIDAQGQSRVLEVSGSANVTISGVTITNGLAGGAACSTVPSESDGGGILIDAGTLTLNNDAITNNTAPGFGGGIADETEDSGASVTITNTTISNNHTCDNADFGADGGGVFTCGCDPLTVENSTISGNTTPTDDGSDGTHGGGIAFEGYAPLTISDTTVSGNTSSAGGGLFTGYSDGGAAVTLTADTFSGNVAVLTAGLARLSSPAIKPILPPAPGGAIYDEVDNISLVNSTVSGNTATDGGGIASGSVGEGTGTPEVTVSFSTIADNTATGSFVGDSTGNLQSIRGGTFTLDDSIVAGGISPAGETSPLETNCNGTTASGAFTSSGFNLFDDTSDAGAQCGAVSTDVVNGSSGLGSLADNGGSTETMALQTGSPAIDAASGSLCSSETAGVDQRGVTRPQGPGCDIGAYEYERADLALQTSASPTSFDVGQSSTVTDTITNNGYSTATGVSFADPASGGVSFTSATASQGNCTHTSSSVSCSIGSIPTGSSVTVTIVVSGTAAGDVTLNSSVSGSLPDPNLANNSTSLLLTISAAPAPTPAPQVTSATPKADLAVTRTRARITAHKGARVSFTLKVTDHGPNTDSAVVLVYRVPKGLRWVSSRPSRGVRCTHAHAKVFCKIASLNSGGHFTVALVLKASRLGKLRDRATVAGAVTDPNLANNAVDGKVTITAAPCAQNLVFRTGWDPSANVSTVKIYIDGSLTRTLHGHNLRTIQISPLPATGAHSVTVAFVIGPYNTVTATRMYHGCTSGPTTYAYPPQTNPGAS